MENKKPQGELDFVNRIQLYGLFYEAPLFSA